MFLSCLLAILCLQWNFAKPTGTSPFHIIFYGSFIIVSVYLPWNWYVCRFQTNALIFFNGYFHLNIDRH